MITRYEEVLFSPDFFFLVVSKSPFGRDRLFLFSRQKEWRLRYLFFLLEGALLSFPHLRTFNDPFSVKTTRPPSLFSSGPTTRYGSSSTYTGFFLYLGGFSPQPFP